MELTLSTLFSGVTLNPLRAQNPTDRIKAIGALALLLIIAVGAVRLGFAAHAWYQNRKIAEKKAEIAGENERAFEQLLVGKDTWPNRRVATDAEVDALIKAKTIEEAEEISGSPHHNKFRLTKAQHQGMKYSINPLGRNIYVGEKKWETLWEEDPAQVEVKYGQIKAALDEYTKQDKKAYCKDCLIWPEGASGLFARMAQLTQAKRTSSHQ